MKKYIETHNPHSVLNRLFYFELKAQHPFNWYEALKQVMSEPNPKTRFLISQDLKLLSQNWITCACGNQCNIIPRSDTGEPDDEILSEQGLRFMEFVGREEYDKAIECLDIIEKRSAELIAELNKSEPSKN